MKHEELTEKIISAFYKVYNTLGFGFLERVYSNALVIYLRKQGLEARTQESINVYYENEKVGYYIADLVVEDKVILELKAGEELASEHEAQLTNYLRATNIEVGLLLGFCKLPLIKRNVFDNELKKHGKA